MAEAGEESPLAAAPVVIAPWRSQDIAVTPWLNELRHIHSFHDLVVAHLFWPAVGLILVIAAACILYERRRIYANTSRSMLLSPTGKFEQLTPRDAEVARTVYEKEASHALPEAPHSLQIPMTASGLSLIHI